VGAKVGAAPLAQPKNSAKDPFLQAWDLMHMLREEEPKRRFTNFMLVSFPLGGRPSAWLVGTVSFEKFSHDEAIDSLPSNGEDDVGIRFDETPECIRLSLEVWTTLGSLVPRNV